RFARPLRRFVPCDGTALLNDSLSERSPKRPHSHRVDAAPLVPSLLWGTRFQRHVYHLKSGEIRHRNVAISTNNLRELPDVFGLRRLLQSLAMLDAVLESEWEYRYYSFNARWNNGEMMGSMRNGQGDEFFALFNAHGVFIKGFVHDASILAQRIPSEVY